jgi:hypothetical protein
MNHFFLFLLFIRGILVSLPKAMCLNSSASSVPYLRPHHNGDPTMPSAEASASLVVKAMVPLPPQQWNHRA